MKKLVVIILTVLSLFACARPPVTRMDMALALESPAWWIAVI
jgi:hypothetical protein